MKKIILFFLLVIGSASSLLACDICGCGVGNSYIGILPDFSTHIFGLRYRYNSLLTHVGTGGTTSYLTTHERYSTLELWGGWNIGKKFRVMASIPYSFDEKRNQGPKQTKNGLGDISFTAYYQLINSRYTTASKLLIQSLWIGAGIKAPTGKYNPTDKSGIAASANLFQLGTGSTDFTVNALYDLRLQDAGINLSAAYKINTTNSSSYNYGNKLNANAELYYKWRLKNQLVIAPNAGIMLEKGERDTDHAIEVDVSGGHVLMGMAGVELSYKSIALGGNFQTPFSQQLANGIIKAGNRAMVHVSFLF